MVSSRMAETTNKLAHLCSYELYHIIVGKAPCELSHVLLSALPQLPR